MELTTNPRGFFSFGGYISDGDEPQAIENEDEEDLNELNGITPLPPGRHAIAKRVKAGYFINHHHVIYCIYIIYLQGANGKKKAHPAAAKAKAVDKSTTSDTPVKVLYVSYIYIYTR